MVDPQAADSPVRTGCPYCGVGCGLSLTVADGRVLKVRGDKAHRSSRGEVCMKAAALPATVANEGRAARARVRAHSAGPLRETSVANAVAHAAGELRRIVHAHGPDAIAFYISGQLGTEDYYALAKLVKGFLGTDNLDTNSRLCMASAVAGYKGAFGADAPPGSYADIDEADVFLIVGANVADCHPILFRRIEKRLAAAPDDVRVIVVDPRRNETCDLAHSHLAVRPGTDVALLNAMLRVAIHEGHVDKQFVADRTEGFGAVRRRGRAVDAGRRRGAVRRAGGRDPRGRAHVRALAARDGALVHGRQPERPRHAPRTSRS